VQTKKLPECISLSSLQATHRSIDGVRVRLSSSKRRVNPSRIINISHLLTPSHIVNIVSIHFNTHLPLPSTIATSGIRNSRLVPAAICFNIIPLHIASKKPRSSSCKFCPSSFTLVRLCSTAYVAVIRLASLSNTLF
jgi:hypothetical protein